MDSLIQLRRDIHMHPELARQEFRTTSVVSAALAEAGLVGRVLPSGTGLMVDIGAKSGPLIALRADMDALPIQDDKDVPYRSRIPNVCHACGHDVHTAILVGAAIELARSDLASFGRVRCIFQPAEESSESGSLDMIAAGALDGVDRIFALHCDPSAQVGTVGTRIGPITSAADHMVIKIKGLGGHSARPNLTPNPIIAVCTVVTSLPDAVNAQLPEHERVLIGFGTISSNGAKNAIPSYAEVSGTVRIPDSAVWAGMPNLIKTAVDNIIQPFELDCDVDYVRVCPAVINDSNASAIIDQAALSVVGRENVYKPPQSFGAEDFSWYLRDVPGAIFRLGVRAHGRATQVDLHSGHFDVDERAIGAGVKMFTRIAIGATRAISSMDKPCEDLRNME
jgi:amidohydrolase